MNGAERQVEPMTSRVSSEAVLKPLWKVTQREGESALASRLFEIRMWLQDELASLEQGFQSYAAGVNASLAEKAAGYLMVQPGKRIRPLSVVLSAMLGGLEMNEVVRQLAMACELVHAATLLHDDVMDEGEMRRGVKAARTVYGNSASVLGGDYLLTEALRSVRRTGDHELLGDLIEVIAVMVQAEAVQLERRGRFEPSEEISKFIIEGKTAGIFAWGMRAGAKAAGLSEDEVEALRQVGHSLGMAFQLIDDTLDVAGEVESTGKDKWRDVREGKLTWPLLIASERAPYLVDAMRQILSGEKKDLSKEEALVAQAIKDSNCLDETRNFALKYGQKAKKILDRFPASEARRALCAVVDSVLYRNH